MEPQTERDHDRDAKPKQARGAGAEATPGRASASSALNGPQQASPSGITGISSETAALMSQAQASPSQGLPGDLRGDLEQELGEDLGGVRVHQGPEANAAAGALDARAYTVGSDIYFADGAYAPDSASGRGLIAHEVAHVVQNGGQGSVGDGMQLSSPGDAHEGEAHAFGESFGSGEATKAPVTRSASVGRAIVSRAPEDPIVTPKTDKTSKGAKVKVSSKSAAFAPYVAHTRKLSGHGSAVDVSATLILGGSGTIEWPDLAPAGTPGVEAEGGGSKSSDKSSDNKQGVDVDIKEWTIKANERAKEEKEWWDALEVDEIKIVGGGSAEHGGGSDASGPKKSESGVGLGVKCEVTLKDKKTKMTGSVNILSIKTGEEKIEGPNIALVVAYPAVQKEWTLSETKKIKAKVSLTGSATVVVKPNWTKLATDAAKLIGEAGLAGALELASTMAVTFAPALFFAAGLSMIEDENELWHWAVKEARESKNYASGLSSGTKLQDNFTSGERAAAGHVAGEKCARQAIAKFGCTEQQYKDKFLDFKTGSDVYGGYLDKAEDKFFAAVEKRARAMYRNSFSMKMFKTEADVMTTWRDKAWQAWLAGLKG